MAAPSVTHSFSNGTVADADEVNTNFTDIINGITDGTKDLSISALTCAGSATLNGNVTLGNASGDDITFTGSLASSIPIKTTNTYDIGSAALGLAGIYFGTADTDTARVVSAALAADATYTIPDAGTSGDFVMTTGEQTVNFGAGSTTLPSIYGDGDTGTGFSFANSSRIDWSGSGSSGGYLNNVGVFANQGSASDPSYCFRSDTDTGMYNLSGNSIGFSVAGTLRARVVTGGVLPGADDTQDLGSSGIRWDDVFATNGTIQTSDRREKRDIESSDLGLSFIKKLNPVKYRWKKTNKSKNKNFCYGFIAQDIQDLMVTEGMGPDGFAGLVEGEKLGLRYQEFIGPMVKAIQELSDKIARLESQITP